MDGRSGDGWKQPGRVELQLKSGKCGFLVEGRWLAAATIKVDVSPRIDSGDQVTQGGNWIWPVSEECQWRQVQETYG